MDSKNEPEDMDETTEQKKAGEGNKTPPAASGGEDAKAEKTSQETSEEDGNKHASKLHRMARRPEVIAGLAAALVIVVLGVLFGTHVLCTHAWAAATCTEPQTCRICGRTQGEPHGHSWRLADCTHPKTCNYCGVTEGEPLGHDWQEATCTAPKTCKRCGATEGKALGHQVDSWTVTKEATCTEEGQQTSTCTRCGQVQTQTLPKKSHTPGDWEVTKDISISPSGTVIPGEKVIKCTVCGTVIEKQSFTIDLTASQRNALAKAASYLSFSAFSHKSLIEQLEYEGFSTDDATFAADHCGADWMKQAEKKAQSYLKFMSFSRSGLIEQLEYEGFTADRKSVV